MFLFFLLIFCQNVDYVNSGIINYLLEYHFDELSDQYAYISSKDEIILEQITLISQFYLLYSTMKHYNKYLEKMRIKDKSYYLYINPKRGLCKLINMRRTLNDLLIKDKAVNYNVHSRDLEREELQEANFIVFYNYLIPQRPEFLKRLEKYYKEWNARRIDQFKNILDTFLDTLE
uniref:Uncharacterized protein n=1 Tax=Meloidogyne enterolobii TaxID=390850 RepID=A0A6V7VA18_MELEN|nr:unnamed protein product [Meloidogyne enterolobii]